MECIQCDAPLNSDTKGSKLKYCSTRCQIDYQHNIKVLNWKLGIEVGHKGKNKLVKAFVKRYLHETRGTACEICKWDLKHPSDDSVLTEIDHIDGDANNTVELNLRILCPNCHSMTYTFRNRNSSSSRVR